MIVYEGMNNYEYLPEFHTAIIPWAGKYSSRHVPAYLGKKSFPFVDSILMFLQRSNYGIS